MRGPGGRHDDGTARAGSDVARVRARLHALAGTGEDDGGPAGRPAPEVAADPVPPGTTDAAGALRRRALAAATTAYTAAYGHPLQHEDAGGARWATATRVAVAACVVLLLLSGVVALRAVVGPPPTVQVVPPPATAADPPATTGPPSAADAPPPGPVEGGTTGDPPPAAEATVVVHVVGQVGAPGLVRLPVGARVADAVAAAGGAAPEADLGALNLARPVTDGEQVRVPLPGEPLPLQEAPVATGSPVAGGPTDPAPGGLVDVNRATASQLEALPGIGPVLAARVVAHRETHGPFASVEALADVAGIGPAVLAGLRDLVTVR